MWVVVDGGLVGVRGVGLSAEVADPGGQGLPDHGRRAERRAGQATGMVGAGVAQKLGGVGGVDAKFVSKVSEPEPGGWGRHGQQAIDCGRSG